MRRRSRLLPSVARQERNRARARFGLIEGDWRLEDRTLLAGFQVTNLNDSGTGSLRAAIAGADAAGGSNGITFASNLNGGTIDLTNYDSTHFGLGLTAFWVSDNISIMGPSASENAIKIQRDPGAGDFRLFSVAVGASLSLQDLTLADGYAQGGSGAYGGGGGAAGLGGAIAVDQGTLNLTTVAVSNNVAAGGQGGQPGNTGNGVVIPGGGGGGLAFDGSIGNASVSGNGGSGGGPNFGGGSGNNFSPFTGTLRHRQTSAGFGGGGGGSGSGLLYSTGNGGPGGSWRRRRRFGRSLVLWNRQPAARAGLAAAAAVRGVGHHGGRQGWSRRVRRARQRGDGTLTEDDGSGAGGGGGGAGLGGAIFLIDSGLNISNSDIFKNQALGGKGGVQTGSGGQSGGNGVGLGGAIFADVPASTVTISANALLSSNSGDSGGAIYNLGSLQLSSSNASGNFARISDAGGVFNGGSATLTNDEYDSNSAAVNGGGVFNNGPLTITGSTFYNNTADSFGGGLFNYAADLLITNSTFYRNIASLGHAGGGILNEVSAVLIDDTIAGNSAATTGGGLWTVPFGVTMNNTIVAENRGNGGAVNDIGGSISASSSFNNLVDDTPSDGGLTSANGNLLGSGYSPDFYGFGNYGGPTETLALAVGSPAIDAGNKVYAEPTDQRGVTRTGNTDIGAFELAPYAVMIYDVTSTSIPVGTPTTLLSGLVSDPISHLPVVGTVLVRIGGLSALATVNPSTGSFTASFPTGSLAASLTPSTRSPTVGTRRHRPAGVSSSATGTLTVYDQLGGLSIKELPSSVIAGNSSTFQVVALDPHGNVDRTYVGTVQFTSTDARAGLPLNYTFTATTTPASTRSRTAVRFVTAGISVADRGRRVSSGIHADRDDHRRRGRGTFAYLLTGLPSTVVAGSSLVLTLEAVDRYNNVTTGYTGTVHFTSTDHAAVLPADYTFQTTDYGVRTFSGVVLKTDGIQNILATAVGQGSINGKEDTTVTSAAASQYVITGLPSSVVAGAGESFLVTVEDPYGNIARGYTGTVHFTSSDLQAALPADSTSSPVTDQGTHPFKTLRNLKTAGNQWSHRYRHAEPIDHRLEVDPRDGRRLRGTDHDGHAPLHHGGNRLQLDPQRRRRVRQRRPIVPRHSPVRRQHFRGRVAGRLPVHWGRCGQSHLHRGRARYRRHSNGGGVRRVAALRQCGPVDSRDGSRFGGTDHDGHALHYHGGNRLQPGPSCRPSTALRQPRLVVPRHGPLHQHRFPVHVAGRLPVHRGRCGQSHLHRGRARYRRQSTGVGDRRVAARRTRRPSRPSRDGPAAPMHDGR